MKKLYGKRWLKIIVWLISVISLLGAEASGMFTFINYVRYQNSPFLESESFRRSLYGDTYNLVTEAYLSGDIQSFGADNIGFSVLRYINNTQTEMLALAPFPKDHEQVYRLYYIYDTQYGNLDLWYENDENGVNTERPDPSLNDEAQTLNAKTQRGEVIVCMKLPEKAGDAFYEQYQEYLFASSYSSSMPVIFAVSALIWVMSLIFLSVSCGHSENKAGIQLLRLDRFPFEILAALAGIAISFVINLPDLLGYWGDFSFLPADYEVFLYGAVISLICYLIFMCVYLSFLRRMKTRTLLTSSVCGWLAGVTRTLIRIVPLTPMAALIAALLFVINALAILTGITGFWHFLVVLIDFFALLSVPFFAHSVMKLRRKSEMLRNGELDLSAVNEETRFAPGFYTEISDNLNQISEGIETAVERQMKSERLKTELITNVSHDIRTPLTSIINYTDLLNRESDEDKRQEYLAGLSRSSQRLKKLSEDLIEASKASTGNLHAEIEKTDLNEIIEQALGEYEDKLTQADLTPVVNMHDAELYALADGRLLWRVLSNLLSNCVKYSQPGTRVYIDGSREGEDKVRITIKNISRDILNVSSDELMERFVRGDSSRSSEGSGLGLNIAQSLCRVMNGSFELSIDGDLFRADILLPAAKD